jgi:hypothetical protein
LAGSLSPDMCQLTGLWYLKVTNSLSFLYFSYSNCAFSKAYDNFVLIFCSDVRNNSLTGSIPENIGNCTSFQVLYVILYHDSFFDSLFYFLVTFLTSFVYARDLSYNQLTGEIPFNIGFLQIATLYVLHSFFFCS